jgi:rsbT antagonist protein RsbS
MSMNDSYAKVPTIRIWDLVLVPLQGEIGDDLAAEMSQDVLEEIHGTETRGLIIDVTGLWLLDSHMCSVLSRLASSAALMGVDTYLCGLSADIALTLQAMQLDLAGVTTVSTLEQAFESLGMRPPEQYEQAQDPLSWTAVSDHGAVEHEDPVTEDGGQ